MDNRSAVPPLDPRIDAAVSVPSNSGILQTGSGNTAVQGDGNTVVNTVTTMHAENVILQGDLVAGASLLLQLFSTNPALLAQFQSVAGGLPSGLPSNPSAPNNGDDSALHRQIDDYRGILDAGDPETALRLLEKLQAVHTQAPKAVMFRLLTNIGAAHLALNNLEEAAAAFVSAYPLEPYEEKALGNLMLAHLIRNNWPAARDVARLAVAFFPDKPSVWGWRVATADYGPAVVPTTVAPKAFHSTVEVAFAIARVYARHDVTTEAACWMKQVYALDPAGADALESMGELHLRRAAMPSEAGDGLVFLQPLSAPQHEAVSTARSFFQRARRLMASKPVSRIQHTLATNLALTHLLLDAPTAAEEVLDQLDASKLPELGRLRAQLAVGRGDWSAALKALDALPDGAFSDQAVMRAEALANLDRTEDALAAVEAALITPGTTRTWERAQVLRLTLIQQRDGLEAARKAGRASVDAGGSTPRLLSFLAELAHESGSAEEADRRFAEAEAALTPESPVPDGIAVAMALLETERTDAGIALLGTLPLPDADTPVVRRLIGSLVDADHRAAAQARLDRLHPTIRNQPFFQRAEAVLCHRRGDLNGAIHRLDAYLQKRPDDLAARLLWLQVQEQRGKSAEIATVLADESLERTTRGSLANQMLLARILANHGSTDRAWALAYATRRKANGDSADDGAAYRGYISLGLFGPGAKALASDFQCHRVDLDTAFTLTGEQGDRTFVIETAADPNREARELPPTHPLAQTAMGLQVGDTIVMPGAPPGSPGERITEIKHKYLYALHVSMVRHRERFPNQQGFWSFQLGRGSTPEEVLAPLISQLKERRAWCEEVEEQYRTGAMPLAMMGGFLGAHAIDVWSELANPERPPVLTCHGTHQERDLARSILDRHDGVVLDPVTLTHIVSLDVADPLIAAAGPLGVTRSTIDSLHRLVNERRTFSKKGQLSVAFGKHGLERHEVSAEAVAANIAFLERVIIFAETRCELLLAQAPIDPPAELVDLFEAVPDPAFLDTLLAARGTGRALLSDDLALRRWASTFLSVDGVWTGVTLAFARDLGHLSPAGHASLVLKMARGRHSFTTVDSLDLFSIAERDGWMASPDFHELICMLAADNVDINSAVSVINIFVTHLWDCPIPEYAKRRVLWGALNVLCTPHRKLWVFAFEAALRHANAGVRGAARLWWSGHFFQVPGLATGRTKSGRRRRQHP